MILLLSPILVTVRTFSSWTPSSRGMKPSVLNSLTLASYTPVSDTRRDHRLYKYVESYLPVTGLNVTRFMNEWCWLGSPLSCSSAYHCRYVPSRIYEIL